MISTVLCIGTSTYNEQTPRKINDALVETNFLNGGSVIFARHRYFPFWDGQQMSLNEQKQVIQEEDFPNCSVVYVDSIETHNIEAGHVYILPDTWGNSRNCGISEFEVSILQHNENLVIQCFPREFDRNKHYADFADDIRYLPCIDLIMGQFSKTNVSNKFGLILAGMEQDGAKGLTLIGLKGGKIAIQNPDECYRPDANNRSRLNDAGQKIKLSVQDMPRAAIQEAENAKISYEVISLEEEVNFKSLTQWLKENVS